MSTLVEYRCQERTGCQEQTVDGIVSPTTVCRACGRSSVRRFGGGHGSIASAASVTAAVLGIA